MLAFVSSTSPTTRVLAPANAETDIKQIATLGEYVLVSQDEHRIEVFRRTADWAGEIARRGERISVHGVMIEIDRIYGTGS